MRRQFIVLTIIAQLAVLGYMAGKREVILATGQQIYLQLHQLTRVIHFVVIMCV